MIAWGGSPDTGARLWFHDLSAGPDWRTGNWNLDAPTGYIIPPVWEYGKGLYRSLKKLAIDLAKVARYVAIDLLFTPSPLYPPALTPDRLPDTIDLDINSYDADRQTDSSESFLKSKQIATAMGALSPLLRFSADQQDREFFDQKQMECFSTHSAAWSAWPLFSAPSCYPDRPYGSYSNLFLYNALNLDKTADDVGKVDYESSGFTYFTPAQDAGPPYLGLADDNHRDGTQSFTYVVLGKDTSRYYGMTGVAIHEWGHHFGMSHTHDGYDYEDDLEFGSYGKRYFAWVGDEVSSPMSYMFVEDDYGRFDRDNNAKFLAATYVAVAQRIARDVAPNTDAQVMQLLAQADDQLRVARTSFAQHRYLMAARHARAAYSRVLQAARVAGVKVRRDVGGTHVDAPSDSFPFVGHDKRIRSYLGDPIRSVPRPWLMSHDHH